jgi:hypothetical protein
MSDLCLEWLIGFGAVCGLVARRWPEWRLGWTDSGVFGAGMAWSGRCGEGAEAGEDLVEQVVSRG